MRSWKCLAVAMLIAGASMAGSSTAGARDVAPDRRELLLRAETALCQAFESGDADALREGLTADFTLVDSRGTVTGLAQNLDEVGRREPYYDEFRNHGQQVRLHGDAAIVIGITSVKGRAGGEAFAADFRYTDTWVWRDGRWLLAASHASRLP